MPEQSAFFSIWTQDSSYWVIIEGNLASKVVGFSSVHHRADLVAQKTGKDWYPLWQQAATQLMRHNGVGQRVAVIASEELPSLQDIKAALKPAPEIALIGANLWLISAANHGRLGCYMQRVVDRRGKQVGHEAFARMEADDGGIIGGGAIMRAAHALRVEYQLDRLLHRQAIESFVESDLEGYIFINFLTGFIHRPEVYLEGLDQAVARNHMRPSAVVLDVPLTDDGKDIVKLKSIAQYCRTRGFSLALDDVVTAEHLGSLLKDIQPAFVKLDRKMSMNLGNHRTLASLEEIVKLCHASGVSVLAEGVETQAQYDLYHAANVDMFQGYLLGTPQRVSRDPQASIPAA